MALEDILFESLNETLDADESGNCPLCGSRIVKAIDDKSVDWSCTSAGCRWAASMSIGLYRDFIDEAGDGR